MTRKKQMSLRQIRLNLGMSQRELAHASTNVLKGLGIKKGVPRNLIYRCERGIPISELSATKLLMTINTLHEWRGRPTLGIDDLTWTIAQRKRKESRTHPLNGMGLRRSTEQAPGTEQG